MTTALPRDCAASNDQPVAGLLTDLKARGLLEEGNPNYRRNQMDRCKALTGRGRRPIR